MATIFFINGPNANLYGLDASGTYGRESFPQLQARCEAHAATLGVTLDFRQSNHEGVMVDWIQEAREKADAIVINAGRADLYVHRHSRRFAGVRGADHRNAYEQYL